MRKLAPVFFSSIIVLASGSALALGDMHKNKKAPSTDNTSQTYTSPAGNPSGSTSATTNSNAVAPTPGSSTYDSINSDNTSPSANSGAAMNGSSNRSDNTSSMSSSTSTAKAKAKKPGNAASTPDARIQRDNNDETNTPAPAPSTNSKMSGRPAQHSGFVLTAYGTGDKGTVSSDDNSGYTKKKQVARNDERCDQSKHKTLPKDCVEHTGTGAAAVNDKQGQSGGTGGAGPGDSTGAGSAGPAGGSSSGSAAGSGGGSK